MQETSKLYKTLLSEGAATETRIAIGEIDCLIDESGNDLVFGDTEILLGDSDPECGFTEEMIYSAQSQGQVFAGNVPGIGRAQSGQVTVTMYTPAGEIPRQARIAPYVRLVLGDRKSEWLPQGVYFTDQRERQDPDTLSKLTLTGLDAMMRAEVDYPVSRMDWPAKDVDVLREIAAAMNVGIDQRTLQIMDGGYLFPYPANYSQREVLGYLAGAYAGNFVISETGDLLLIPIWGLPEESNLLVDESGNVITFGGDAILV